MVDEKASGKTDEKKPRKKAEKVDYTKPVVLKAHEIAILKAGKSLYFAGKKSVSKEEQQAQSENQKKISKIADKVIAGLAKEKDPMKKSLDKTKDLALDLVGTLDDYRTREKLIVQLIVDHLQSKEPDKKPRKKKDETVPAGQTKPATAA